MQVGCLTFLVGCPPGRQCRRGWILLNLLRACGEGSRVFAVNTAGSGKGPPLGEGHVSNVLSDLGVCAGITGLVLPA